MAETIKIGTRGSQLALWQSEWVKAEIEKHNQGITAELVVIKTKGDKILDVPLAKVGKYGKMMRNLAEEYAWIGLCRKMKADGRCCGPSSSSG